MMEKDISQPAIEPPVSPELTRREFLRMMGVLAAGLVLPSCAPSTISALAETGTPTPPSPGVTPTLTSTLAPTKEPTPKPTLTEAQTLVSRLVALPGYTWGVSGEAGDQVVLVDQSKATVATLDTKAGGVQWDSKNHLPELNTFLTNPDGQKNLTSFLNTNKDLVHFVAYASAPDNGKTPPPHAVVSTTNGKDIKLVQGPNGTDSFAFNQEFNRVAAIARSADRAICYVNPDGSLDYAPIVDLVNTLPITGFDKGTTDRIKTLLVELAQKYPYGYSPDEMNAIFNSVNGGREDFRTFFNNKYAPRYPSATFDRLMTQALPRDVYELLANRFYRLGAIRPGPLTLWVAAGPSGYGVSIAPSHLDPNEQLYHVLAKELIGAFFYFGAVGAGVNNRDDQLYIGEHLSFLTKVVTEVQNNASRDLIREDVDWAYKEVKVGDAMK